MSASCKFKILIINHFSAAKNFSLHKNQGYFGHFNIRFGFDYSGWGHRTQGFALRIGGEVDWLADLKG